MADYAAIIAAIDTAIQNWAGKPMTITVEGRTITYRSFQQLIEARKYYAQLAAQGTGGKGFKITNLKATSAK